MAANNKTPFGGAVKQFGFWDWMGTSENTHALNLVGATPAQFLPNLIDDEQVECPIVMYPGTIVGILNERDHTAVPAYYRNKSPSVVVPAHGHASGYTVTYGSLDLATNRYGVATPDLDSSTGVGVTATGASSASVVMTYPLGVVQEPVYSSYFQTAYTNYKIQPKIGVLARGRVFRIPAITAEEKDIFAGDLVIVSNTAGTWDPAGAPTTSYPGRWKKFDPTGSDCAQIPLVIGRCVGRHRIVRGTASAGTLLRSDLANVDTATLNEAQGYHTLNRVQTVPGFTLTGSGTKGVPYPLTFARADTNGDYWALDIAIGLLGV
jgi:hypothetical protein